jgi:cytochrome c biogenesis protein
LNLIVCTLERFPKTLTLLRHRDDHIDPQKLVKFTYHKEFVTRLPWDDTQDRITRTISREFGPVRRIETPGAYGAIAEKGRWSLLMVYVIHFSVLIVLSGALVGSIFGFKGFMNISEGQASGQVAITGEERTVDLPFQVRCDDFDASFYETGAPKEFRSDLTIIDGGKETLKRTIRVNDPLTYAGVTFYQSSYGSSVRRAEVEFQDVDSGKTYSLTLPYREPVQIPGTKDRVQAMQYQQNMAQFGPALGLVLFREGLEPSGSWILVDMPQFHGNRIQNYQIKVNAVEQSEYTGLQVKRDPGVWLVWLGFVAMLTGIGLTFYSSHRKLWIWSEPTPEGKSSWKVILAGRTNKNSLAFEQDFAQLCEQLHDELNPDTKRK